MGTMTNGFKFLRSVSTGRTGYYPAHFVDHPDLVEVEEYDGCVDCVVEAPAPEIEKKAELLPVPAPRTMKVEKNNG